MDSHQCLCGTWISRAKQEQIFEPEALKQLDKNHEQLHRIANVLLLQYQEGDIEAARANLSELQIAFDAMSNPLGTAYN